MQRRFNAPKRPLSAAFRALRAYQVERGFDVRVTSRQKWKALARQFPYFHAKVAA
jgi:hypothetical protein